MALCALGALNRLLPTLAEGAADSACANVLVPALCTVLGSSSGALRSAAEGALTTLHAMSEGGGSVWQLMASSAQYGSARVRLPLLELFHMLLESPAGADRPPLLLKHVLPVSRRRRRRRAAPPARERAPATCASRSTLPPRPPRAPTRPRLPYPASAHPILSTSPAPLQLALRLLDEKAPDIKAANGKLLSALHATLGPAMLDESTRLSGPSFQKLRSQLPDSV